VPAVIRIFTIFDSGKPSALRVVWVKVQNDFRHASVADDEVPFEDAQLPSWTMKKSDVVHDAPLD
jgi:hypothetical protein